jgi:cation transport ATPase
MCGASKGNTEVEIDASGIKEGDLLKVYMGPLIPVDGEVVSGEVQVNGASMTGESRPVTKRPGSSVYAATAVESGMMIIRATKSAGSSRIDDIVTMVEDSSEAKATAQSAAERMADGMVPVSLGTFLAVLLITRDMVKATSVLMVDYSCAIELTTPVAVMSAMREATRHNVLVKGGKYLEALAAADVSVAMSDASDIARTVADVSIMNASLDNLLYARELGCRMMNRIHRPYRIIVTLNTLYIALGIAGILQPTASALLHNGTTVVLTVANTRNLIDSHRTPKQLLLGELKRVE